MCRPSAVVAVDANDALRPYQALISRFDFPCFLSVPLTRSRAGATGLREAVLVRKRLRFGRVVCGHWLRSRYGVGDIHPLAFHWHRHALVRESARATHPVRWVALLSAQVLIGSLIGCLCCLIMIRRPHRRQQQMRLDEADHSTGALGFRYFAFGWYVGA